MIVYYLNLLFRKIFSNIHNFLETKKDINKNSENCSNLFYFLLFKNVYKKLSVVKSGIYFKTKIQNSSKPLILSQARILLIFSYQFNNNNSISNKWIIAQLVNYVKGERNEEGYYTFNYSSWDKQDEGIATVWVLIALLKGYEVLQDISLLEFIIETSNIMLDKLYSERTSLVHTRDDNFWCLNAASTLAWFLSDLLKHHYDERYEKAMNNSINICLDMQTDEGFFPYSEKRTGTYLLLYNPIVVYTLAQCKNSVCINVNLCNKLENKLSLARKFILSNLDKEGFFVEPEVKKYSRYIISNVTSLVALKGFISTDIEEQILKNIFKFMKNGELFLCINDDYKLFNSSLFRLRDQLSIEVLYWLQVYQN